MNDEQLKAIEIERLAFRKATEDLRSELFSKELELRSELAKKDPSPVVRLYLASAMGRVEAHTWDVVDDGIRPA